MFSDRFKTTFTVTAGAYTANDNVGGKKTLTGITIVDGGTLNVNSIILADHDKQEAEMDILFFNADPTGSTLTNDSATNIVDADAGKVAGIVTISPAHYVDCNGCSIATLQDINLDITAVAGKTLYFTLTTRGTPTFTDVDHLEIIINYRSYI